MTMNTPIDEWGHDPTVQRVRRLFTLMENEQNALLNQLSLSSLDARLHDSRKTALKLYERACSLAAPKRLAWDEKTYAAVYITCLITVLEKLGIRIPDDVLRAYQRHADLLREVME
jgi:hypothetical protein